MAERCPSRKDIGKAAVLDPVDDGPDDNRSASEAESSNSPNAPVTYRLLQYRRGSSTMSVHELWGFIKYIGMGKQSCAEKRKESMTEQRTQRIIL